MARTAGFEQFQTGRGRGSDLCYLTGIREKGWRGSPRWSTPSSRGYMEVKGLHRFPRTIPYETIRTSPNTRKPSSPAQTPGDAVSLTAPFVRRVWEWLEEEGDHRGAPAVGVAG